MSVINLWPFKRSENEQFEELLKPHLERLYKLAYRLTGQPDDAEDLVQDVLLKLYPRLAEMQKIEKLSPWLARVLYRLFVDKYRSQQRSPIDYTDEDHSLYENHASHSPQPQQLIESELSQDRLIHALGQLNEDQRVLVMLHDVEGYTLQEIHQMQDVAIGTLKSRLSRARTKLQLILSQLEPFTGSQRVNG